MIHLCTIAQRVLKEKQLKFIPQILNSDYCYYLMVSVFECTTVDFKMVLEEKNPKN